MKRVLLLVHISLLCGFANPGYTQVVKWNAQWIMHPSVQPQGHSVILFRKSFTLAEKPEKFVIHLSADNHYRLFVNGRYVLRGPARGDLSHWFYETTDIADYLQQGKNTIAAEVVNWGPKRSFTYFSQMTSFILQGETDAENIVNTYGGTWKCTRNKAIHPRIVEWMTDRSSVDFGLYVGNPADSVQAEKYPWGWEKTDYDDNDWPAASWCDIAGGRDSQYAGGILYSGGKMLIPRRTGLLREEKTRFTAIRRSSGVDNGDSFIRGKGSLKIAAGSKISILIDNGVETLGYPELIISGGTKSIIRATYAENLIKATRAPKGDRNSIEGKYIVGIKDIFIPDGGEKRLFKPTYIRAFRYIQLDIETAADPLFIDDYYNVACHAPLEMKALFSSDDPLTDWIMEAGWRTISICAQDMLISDAAYEQMQYTGDSRVHNLSILALSGDDRLTRNALIQFDQSRIPEGLTYACYPNPFHLIIPSYSLIWIDQVYDYMMWKDDSAFISGLEPGIRSVLGWYERKLQPNGLLGKIDWWGALAWPRHYENGEPPSVYEGNNTLYTLHYAYTLRHAAAIEEYLNRKEQAEQFNARADRICSDVNNLCRNKDGFYTESPSDNRVSQITNILAVLAGTVRGDEARRLMITLTEPRDWFGQVDLFLHLYLFEALDKTGLGDRFMGELSEWKTMKDRNMTTFAEVPLEWGEENQRSECHPWSSSPDYFFFRTVCGIRAVTPGHREIEISPSFGNLNHIKAIYPHFRAGLELELRRSGKNLEGEITVPEEVVAYFTWNGKTVRLKTGKQQIRM